MPTAVDATSGEHVAEYLASLQGFYKPATCRTRYTAVQRFFSWLVDEREIDDSPMRRMHPPQVPFEVREGFTRDELQALFATCEGRDFLSIRDQAIFAAMLSMGLRVAEICSLKVEGVIGGEHIIIKGKGAKERVVRMGHTAAVAVRRYLRRRTKVSVTELFVGIRKEALKPAAVKQMFTRRGAEAGVKRCHPHRMRRTFALEYLESGGQAENLRLLMGHSSQHILRTYVAQRAGPCAGRAQGARSGRQADGAALKMAEAKWREPDPDRVALWRADAYSIKRIGARKPELLPADHFEGIGPLRELDHRNLYLKLAPREWTRFRRQDLLTLLSWPKAQEEEVWGRKNAALLYNPFIDDVLLSSLVPPFSPDDLNNLADAWRERCLEAKVDSYYPEAAKLPGKYSPELLGRVVCIRWVRVDGTLDLVQTDWIWREGYDLHMKQAAEEAATGLRYRRGGEMVDAAEYTRKRLEATALYCGWLVQEAIDWLCEEPTLCVSLSPEPPYVCACLGERHDPAPQEDSATFNDRVLADIRAGIAVSKRKPGMGQAVCHARDHIGLSARETFEIFHNLLGYAEMQENRIARYLKNGRQRLKEGKKCVFCKVALLSPS